MVRTRSDPLLTMGLVGQGSNQELAVQLSRVADRILKIRDSRAPAPPVVSSLEQRRRPLGSITEAVSMVLGSVGEMRVRDIHAAIEAMLEEPVSRSSVENCLNRKSMGHGRRFDRVGRGRYRLPR